MTPRTACSGACHAAASHPVSPLAATAKANGFGPPLAVPMTWIGTGTVRARLMAGSAVTEQTLTQAVVPLLPPAAPSSAGAHARRARRSPRVQWPAQPVHAGHVQDRSHSRQGRRSGAAPELSSVAEIVAELRAGRMVVIMDDEDRENEGDLIMAAEHATPEAVAFMIRYDSGIICVPMPEEQLNRLELPQMVPVNSESHRTAFTVSVDLRAGSTGVSSADRAATIRALADPASAAGDFARPGDMASAALAARRRSRRAPATPRRRSTCAGSPG